MKIKTVQFIQRYGIKPDVLIPDASSLPSQPGIYKITNLVNGLSYIGQSDSLRSRIKYHIKASLRPPARGELLIVSALREYGISNFEFEVIGIELRKDRRLLMENCYITRLNTIYPYGYNRSSLLPTCCRDVPDYA